MVVSLNSRLESNKEEEERRPVRPQNESLGVVDDGTVGASLLPSDEGTS